MSTETDRLEVERRFGAAIDALEQAVDSRIEREAKLDDADAVLQRMANDRAKLAETLDGSKAKAKRLSEANREVSARLVKAMEAIRSVLDRNGVQT